MRAFKFFLFNFLLTHILLKGTIKQVIQLTDIEGDPFLATINGTFMALGTTQGIIKVFDLSRRYF